MISLGFCKYLWQKRRRVWTFDIRIGLLSGGLFHVLFARKAFANGMECVCNRFYPLRKFWEIGIWMLETAMRTFATGYVFGMRFFGDWEIKS